ncbi:hypothetical protein D5274_16210 [bacterium 1XD42-94]|nr:hypothetical protein [bacterium 1XD42-76]NBK06625.1 hypothetical protein [bacterium 1XD42-94]
MEKEKAYKVLSLDLWDTVIRRDCHPDEIKTMTAEYLSIRYGNKIVPEKRLVLELVNQRIRCEQQLGKLMAAQGYDDEYELYDVIRQWLTCIFIHDTDISDELIQELYQYELEKELEHACLDSGIIKQIELYHYDSLIIISDFYIGADFIRRLLEKVCFPFPISRIYISCESRYNKRCSNLFRYVLEDLQIAPQEQLHIGDNAHSDVSVPDALGIHTIHYLPPGEHAKRLDREKKFQRKIYNSATGYSDFPVPRTDMSVFFSGFVGWIAEYCIQKGIKKLYFFTREGEFYKQLFDMWAAASRYKRYLPETYILEVSRVATFLPSLREVTTEEMMRIWNQYSCQSMAALFKSLRLNAETGKTFTDKYGIDFEAVLTYPWLLEPVQMMFKDNEFISWIQQEINNSRQLLLEYCQSKALTRDTQEQIGIVDIGWRGTIQDNLCYIFPNCFICGFYIGLVEFLNQQPANSEKHGYINFNPKSNSLFHTLTPFEMICNSPNGSTFEYRRTGQGVAAVRRKEEQEDHIYYTFTKSYQERILNGVEQLSAWDRTHYVLPLQYHTDAFHALYLFCCYPETECANAYFSLVHNEEFGVGEYVDKRTRLQLMLMVSAIFSKKKRIEFKNFLLETTWPQGYLKKYHLTPLLNIYNRIVEKYDAQNAQK